MNIIFCHEENITECIFKGKEVDNKDVALWSREVVVIAAGMEESISSSSSNVDMFLKVILHIFDCKAEIAITKRHLDSSQRGTQTPIRWL